MKTRSLLDIDTSLLKEYKQLENLNPGSWDIGEYLNLKYDINGAIAFSKLYFPDFIEYDGCVILGFRFNKLIFKQWYDKFNGNKSEVERMCNFYEIKDYFHLNQVSYSNEEEYNKALTAFAAILKSSWEINLRILYPSQSFQVDVFEEYDTIRITLYSI
jgi:hypothetical protein